MTVKYTVEEMLGLDEPYIPSPEVIRTREEMAYEMGLKLRPCPFCGEKIVTNKDDSGWWHGSCINNCFISAGFPAEDEAIIAMNTRTATEDQFSYAVHDGEAWRKVRTCANLQDTCDFQCSECGFSVSTVPEGALDWNTDNWGYCPSCGAEVIDD